MKDGTISAEELCAMTGLTDRRHRQLAEQGFFPPPIKGNYQLAPTISGMFRYYRESFQKSSRTLVEDRQTKLRKEIELLELKIQQEHAQMAPIEVVVRVWKGACIAARQIIQSSEIPEQMKQELVAQFQKVDASDYYRNEPDTEGEPIVPTD
jgi:hypothetical protein